MEQYQNILYSLDDGVALITLNRPKAWNALCYALGEEVLDVLHQIRRDKTVRALIVTGGKRVFAAGADIKGMLDATPMEAQKTSDQGHEINDALECLPFPTIAAIEGPALGGGCEMSLACDFRIVGESAVFGFPETGLGILPGAGGTQRITRLIGPSRAKEMILLGRKFSAAEACEIGLATKMVPDAQALEEARKVAEQVKNMPAYAVSLAKRAIQAGETYGMESGKKLERDGFCLCFSNPDQREGMHAFVEKRPPSFQQLW